MTLRVLHTSDWHLGVTTEGASRRPEHEAFLGWLRATIEERSVDVLVVAGDLFDQAQPSAEALGLYYRFLISLADTRLRKVVLIGGNHDSAARLDAPRELLGALDVHVVGGFRVGDEGRTICPIPGPNGEGVEAVVIALPFVHEFHLGIRTTALEARELRSEFTRRFGELYTALADRAQAEYPGVPLLATGHLTAYAENQADRPDRDDYPFEIHAVGTIAGLPASVFDPRLRYVALGHVHRMLPVGAGPAWYCGSPIPLNAKEAATPRRVLLVDVDPATDGPLRPEVLTIPVTRSIELLRGTPEAVEAALAGLRWDEARPPLVFVEAEVKTFDVSFDARVHEVLAQAFPDAGQRPHVLRIAQRQVELDEPDDADAQLAISLDEPPSPLEVFEQLCAHQKVELDEALRATFAEAVSGAQVVGWGDADSEGAAP